MLHSNNPIIKHKVGLLNLAEELGNVSQACRIMGLSRDTFYRYQEAVDTDGVDALLNANRRIANIKNRVDENIEIAVVKHATDFPTHGQSRASNELRKAGVFISPSGIRSVWMRHDLACFKNRLRDLEEQVARDGVILTEAQVTALERKKEDDQAAGEIETAHPGYLGSQYTFYVGPLKVLAGFTSRPLWIHMPKLLLPNCTQQKHRLPPLIYSMTRFFLFSLNTTCPF